MPTSSNNSSSSNPDASDLYNLYMSFLLNLGAHLKSFVSYIFTLCSLSMRARLLIRNPRAVYLQGC